MIPWWWVPTPWNYSPDEDLTESRPLDLQELFQLNLNELNCLKKSALFFEWINFAFITPWNKRLKAKLPVSISGPHWKSSNRCSNSLHDNKVYRVKASQYHNNFWKSSQRTLRTQRLNVRNMRKFCVYFYVFLFNQHVSLSCLLFYSIFSL